VIKSFITAIFLLATFCFTSISVSAQGVNDFVVESFDATYSLTDEDLQGLLTVTEEIVVNYNGQNQGLLRAIPNKYKNNDLNLRITSIDRDGEIEPYITYPENDNTVIRIGQAGTYITGQHAYVINYQLENVISFYETYDEFYWDINGDQWLQAIDAASVSLQSSAPRNASLKSECFTGPFGSEQSNCEAIEQAGGLEAKTNATLGPNETLTIVQTYEKGHFAPQTFWEKYQKYWPAALVVGFQLLVLKSAYKKWHIYGRDDKSRGIIAPYFERPKSASLMQASYVADNTLTPKHISAAIIDLAVRGYIQIVETADKKPKHELVLKKPIDQLLTNDEQALLKSLFSSQQVGDSVKLEDKKNKLYTTLAELKTLVDTSTKENGLFELSPTGGSRKFAKQYGLGVASAVIGFFAGSISAGVTIGVGVVVMILVVVLGSLMSKRSQEGNYLKEHMAGLKLYLSKAEKDRMAMQDAVAAPLAPRSGQPTRNVKFFEKLLPYAVAAGVEKTWANAFQDIYTQPPEWFNGNWSTFNTAALVSSIVSTSQVAGTSFAAPSNSGASGSGGGGFSGGGGGGGGGGGW
jgi:uncharacterized membrane protein YgcG